MVYSKLILLANLLSVSTSLSWYYPINNVISDYDLILRSNYQYYGNSDSDLILNWELNYIPSTDNVGIYSCDINLNYLYESINTDFYISPFISDAFSCVELNGSARLPFIVRLNKTYGFMFRCTGDVASEESLISMINVYYYNLEYDNFFDFNSMSENRLFGFNNIVLDGYNYLYFDNMCLDFIFNSSTNNNYVLHLVSCCSIDFNNSNVVSFLENNNLSNSMPFTLSLSNMASSLMVDNNYNYYYDQGFRDGKENGYTLGLEANPSYWTSLWTSIWLVPSYILGDFLNFELFGVNLQNVLFGLITALVVISIIGALIKVGSKK